MLSPAILGLLPPTGQFGAWLLRNALEAAQPQWNALLADPAGYASRVGEVLVWQNDTGQHVIAGLQGVAESQVRVEQAVAAVEATQLGMAGSLHALQALSMATLGIASLSSACIMWRLHALTKRLNVLESKIADIEEHLSAQDKAHLRQGVSKLREYDQSSNRDDVLHARDDSQYAANVYGELARHEAHGKKRLPVLNYRGRCYILALMTELRARLLLGSVNEGLNRLEEEQGHLRDVASATFQAAIGDAPEVFLDPNLRSAGVTLDLMTEVYRQAQSAGAVERIEVRTASQMFEHLRERLFAARSAFGWVWSLVGEAQQESLEKLKYLIACLEDTNRINGLRMLLSTANDKQISLEEVAARVESWQRRALARRQ